MANIPDFTLDAGLPANIDAEKTILAHPARQRRPLRGAESWKRTISHSTRTAGIFLRMTELMNEQRAVDIVTLSNELARYKEVEAVGGVAYLASLTEGLPRRRSSKSTSASSRTRACCAA